MKYKQISLKKSAITGDLYFTEEDLHYDRQDTGEYIFITSANIYQDSDPIKWKRLLLDKQKEEALKDIQGLHSFINKIDEFSNSL